MVKEDFHAPMSSGGDPLHWREYDYNYKHKRPKAYGFRLDSESQGWLIDTMMEREMLKQSNLKARLKDLGCTAAEIEHVYVVAGNAVDEDFVQLPWSVIYRLFNSTHGTAMGVKG